MDLEVRRCHARSERPVLGAADQRPASLDRPAGVGHVAAPERERRCGAGRRHLELRVRRVVDLERAPAQEARCSLVDARLHLEHRRRHRGIGKGHGVRAPLERHPDRLARLGPPPGVEQRLGDVAAERIAVRNLEPVCPRPSHCVARDLDGLVAPPEQRQRGREVERRPERDIRIVELPSESQRLPQLADPDVAGCAPGVGHADRAQGVGLDVAGRLADLTRDRDRLLADPGRLREVAEEHERLGQGGEDERSQLGPLGGHDRCRASVLRQRPVVVAERSRDPAEHLVDRGRDLGVLALTEPTDGRLEVGERTVRPACGEGHLGRLVQELAVGRPRAARGPQLECELARREGIRGGVETLGRRRGCQRRRPGPCRLERRQPVGEGRGRIAAE